MRRVTTMADVALEARVSVATVSRVLDGRASVDPVLAKRVLAAAARLDYRPNRVARSLRTKRSPMWALIISDVRNSFFTDVAVAVEEIADAAGYSVILCNSQEDLEKERRYLRLAAAERMSGAILSPESTTETDISALADAGVHVVTVDRRLERHIVDHVVVDNAHGVELAVLHLAQNGFTRIACITGPPSATTGSERLLGYRRGLARAGLNGPPGLIRTGDFREESGYDAMRSLLELPYRPDAVFVANHLMTVGALRAIDEAGLAVPHDIAIVGFDDTPWAPLMRPSLTTVAQPTYDVGAEASRLLLGRIEGYRGAVREVLLQPALRVRASSVADREGHGRAVVDDVVDPQQTPPARSLPHPSG
jgi:LacI family transcriptional regulator